MTRLSRKRARALGIDVGPARSKYGNKKPVVDGIRFDSKKEANFYCELKILKRAGQIKDFELQPEFELQPGFRDKDGNWVRPIKYRADFKIVHNDGSIEIVDVKGHRTKEYMIKRKMLLFKYPEIKFREV